MDVLAFLTAPFALALKKIGRPKPDLPTFEPRWWYRGDRLDARPVAWSLRNRPDDWQWHHQPYTIEHKPSRHVFWVGNGWGFYRLYEANCSCTSRSRRGHFQRFQQGVFGRAYRHWRRHQAPPVDPQQFASHFVRADDAVS